MTDKTAFRPSSISRYTHCNLWRHLPKEERTPEELAYLQKGTDEHKRLEQELFSDKETECKAYFEKIKQRCVYFFKEQHLEMEIDAEFLGGTPDVYGYDEASKTLHVIDYKTGRSYVVAENNDQLLAYAMLVMNRHDDWKIEQIELAILNTQHDAVNRHVYMGTLYVERLKARIEKALEKNIIEESFGRPGGWCHFCPSKRYCIRQKSYHALKKYADMDTDQLIYEKEKRQKELLQRLKELKTKEGLSDFFDYELIEKKRFKYRKDAPGDLVATKKLTAAEARKILDKISFEKYFEEETINAFAIGDKKI